MYRTALRSSPRVIAGLRQTATSPAARRFASTTPARRGTWRGTILRLGLLGGAFYWYTTSPIFAAEAQPAYVAPPAQFSDNDLPTVEAVVEQKRKEAEARLAKAKATEEAEASANAAALSSSAPASTDSSTTDSEETTAVGGASELEEEAGQQGAFNPETGEINWDCPCLGGMAHGPCGEEFKAAFSCFVYSKEEPKGMDCIDKFQFMQDCFRKHPEVYGEELADDEEEGAQGEAGAPAVTMAAKDTEDATTPVSTAPGTTSATPIEAPPSNVVPSKAHDALAANAEGSSEETKTPAKEEEK